LIQFSLAPHRLLTGRQAGRIAHAHRARPVRSGEPIIASQALAALTHRRNDAIALLKSSTNALSIRDGKLNIQGIGYVCDIYSAKATSVTKYLLLHVIATSPK